MPTGYEIGYLHNCFNEVSTRQCAMAIASFDIYFTIGLVFVEDSIASCSDALAAWFWE